ncbi:uncharacterized protein BP5553_06903 [Venustampulla echinocandica]|uniref:Myb-like domain-containing protein n=1 Tax=Venustampulla echinocandica TaxID=2656787 RepID=A0A370THZ2_9HELO|nr:uncharacterized protein BP5553_06903 [Venustampulla echinocandica]RDL34972.1 hypothetical protein BP5553_06903 [Venustampulla echinocandica]
MAPSESKERKVRISFTNWVAGGSLLSVPKGPRDERRRAPKVTVTQPTDNIKQPMAEKDKKDDAKLDDHVSQNQSKLLGEQKLDNNSAIDTTSISGKSWTEEQDSKLREMKKANKSWKEITIALGASKKEVVARHNELTQMDDGAAEANQSNDAIGKDDKPEDGGFGDMAAIFDDAVDVGENTTPEQGVASAEGGSKPQKSDKQKGKEKALSRRPQEGDQKSEECDCPDCIQERQAGRTQQGINYGKVGQIYPESSASGGQTEESVHRSLQPDNIWTEEDCRILEELEKRHRENKWLEVQAGFFNWTGRMVAAEIIEKKFKGDRVA